LLAHLAVGIAIAKVDFEDLLLQILGGEAGLLTDDFPQALARESEPVHLLLDRLKIRSEALCLTLRSLSIVCGFVDLRLLISIPNHGKILSRRDRMTMMSVPQVCKRRAVMLNLRL
jgi:hypothetical protein